MIAVFGVKGSPGATTTALLIAALWPSAAPAVVVGADPAGDDLPLRLAGPSGQALPSTPSIASLAVDCSSGSALAGGIWPHALQTAAAIPTVLGLPSPAPMDKTIRQHGTRLADALASYESVILDCGRLTPSSPALVFAAAADVVVLVVPDSAEGCFHARDLLGGLLANAARKEGVRSVVVPIVVAEARRAAAAAAQLTAAVSARGIPAEAPLSVAWDPRTVARLCGSGLVGMSKTPLVRSAAPVAAALYDMQLRIRSERGLRPQEPDRHAMLHQAAAADAQRSTPTRPDPMLGPPAFGARHPHETGDHPGAGQLQQPPPRRMSWPPTTQWGDRDAG